MVQNGTPEGTNVNPPPVVPETDKPKIRVFVADNREFPDPDPALPIGEIQRMMADFMPELHNADVKEEVKDGKTYYRFTPLVGKKG